MFQCASSKLNLALNYQECPIENIFVTTVTKPIILKNDLLCIFHIYYFMYCFNNCVLLCFQQLPTCWIGKKIIKARNSFSSYAHKITKTNTGKMDEAAHPLKKGLDRDRLYIGPIKSLYWPAAYVSYWWTHYTVIFFLFYNDAVKIATDQ